MNESETQKDETTTPVVPEVNETDAAADIVAEVKEEAAEMVEEVKEEVSEAVDDMKETMVEVKEEVMEAAPDMATGTAATTASVAAAFTKSKEFLKTKKYTVATLALVLVALLALVYALEDKGKLDTGIFDGVQKQISKNTAAAKVNNAKISEYDLEISMTQLSSGAAAQGADITDPAVQTEIRTQALDMLVNTELLKQEAAARGIEVTEDEVNTRLETLKTDVGGEEVLNQRMAEFGINQKTLLRDIKNELTIQKLLDEVFKEKSVAVTDEEIADFYEQSGGVKAGLPALEEVKAQIEQQLKATKEQSVVTAYIEELRGKAEIETLI
jgi:peptidyl-prolyl cis-trans isomerase SurA